MSLGIPYFPRVEDGETTELAVCPECLDVVDLPQVHWIERHGDLTAGSNFAAALAVARGSTPTTSGADGSEKGGGMSATAEKQQAGTVADYVAGALRRAGEKVGDLDEGQRSRALAAPDEHPGLRGKSLVAFVLDGVGIQEQVKQAENDRAVRDAELVKRSRSEASKKASPNGPPKAKASRASAYPPQVRAATKALKDLKGPNGAPGPKQHQHVRGVVVSRLAKGGPSADLIVEQSGAKSLAHLRKIAKGDAPREDLKVLRPLADAMGTDAFCKGRNLAAILTVWAEEL